MADLPTRYEPTSVEARVFERWVADGFMSPEPDGTAAENYSIAIPPPNVTGVLHMGHALNGSIQDTLIRFARMHGKRTRWILGSDHAGIATQTQVEKLLASQGSSRTEVGREEFVRRVWQWREQYGGTIIEQFKRLGASCDYSDERFTLDEDYVRAVMKVFVDLYDKGLIYRDYYMVNWDPGSRSAISDLEVEEREVADTLYWIDYPLASGHGSVTVATVRPETMLADVAIAVHPDDERYTRLVGETAILPLVGRRLDIIADPYVKPEFGTGALKITPGHDPNDFEIGRTHNLPEISVIGEDGLMTEEAGERFAGLPVMEARSAVVAALREQGLISRTEPYTHPVPHSARSGERIEPLISLQWFMRMDELAAPAIDVVRDGRVRIHPPNQEKRYIDWLENIRPWCVSRQLWWGHQIPVWYREDEVYVGIDPPEGEGWERDPDVLDTWFSSALWPFATLGWPGDTPALRAFYPTDVLSTARDILFLWVARMVMLGLEFTGDIPFDRVNVHTVIQAPDGRRMSKSLGTGVDPLALIDGGERPPAFTEGGAFPAYGADAVRWGLLAMSSQQDVRFSEEKIAQGARLTNKLWNASRLVLLALAERSPDARVPAAAPVPQTVEDAWILSRLQRAKSDLAARIDAFDFSKAALGLYDFVYGELCDWYLELIKPRLYGEADADGVGDVALHVLAETLAMAHPIIPFVTEEIWGHLPGASGLLATSSWPAVDDSLLDDTAEGDLARAITAVTTLRGWRERIGAASGARVPARLGGGRLRADRRERRPAGADGVERERRRRAGRGRLGPRRLGHRAEVRRGRLRGRRAAPRRRRRAAAGRDRPRRGEAGERALRRQGARRGRPGRARQAGAAARRAGGAGVSWTVARAEEHLLSLELFGMRFGLERMRRLLVALGSPQRAFRAVHVVGTNGKSSTARMTAALLAAHGVPTGTFLSPHLVSFAERIRIGDRDLAADAFGAAIERAARAAEKVDRGSDDRVTQFELLTAAALAELAASEVEVGVIEAGLGGRWDATNVLDAPVVVLTSIGLEHTRWLGPTITDIAREKLAVVRPGATLVIPADLHPDARTEVDGLDARVVVVDAAPAAAAALPGYQRANFALARAAAEASLGRPLDPESVASVAATISVPGRLQVVDREPLTIVDGAHNPDGIAALAAALPELAPGKRVAVAISILEDKDAAAMLRALIPAVDALVCTANANPRALSPATLHSLAGQLGFTGPREIEPDPHAALARTRALAGPDGVALATGSIYLIADLAARPGRRRASAL